MKKNIFFVLFFLIVFFISGCEEGTTVEEKGELIELTTDERIELGKAIDYCSDLVNLDLTDDLDECVKDELGWSLGRKWEKWKEQASLRREMEKVETELYEKEHYNLKIGETSKTLDNLEITLISVRQEDVESSYLITCENQECINIIAEIEIKNVGNKTQRIGVFSVMDSKNYIYTQNIGIVGDIEYHKLEGNGLAPNQIAKGGIYFKEVANPAVELYYSNGAMENKRVSWAIK